MTTETQTRPVTFVSFAAGLEVIREPQRPQVIQGEGGLPKQQGFTKGDRAIFENRKFTTDDPVMIEYLRNHDLFNHQRGFREDYDAGRPSVEAQIDAVTDFAVEADIDGLRSLIEAEESHGDGGRSNVVGPARAALAKLEQQRETLRRIEQEEQDDREQAEADAAAERADVARDEQIPDEPAEGGIAEEPVTDDNGANGSHPPDSD